MEECLAAKGRGEAIPAADKILPQESADIRIPIQRKMGSYSGVTGGISRAVRTPLKTTRLTMHLATNTCKRVDVKIEAEQEGGYTCCRP